MSHKLLTIAFSALALTATLLVVYARPFSTIADTQQTLTANAGVAESNPPVADRSKNLAASTSLALQPEVVKLCRRIGGQRCSSKTPPALIVQGLLSIDSERQQIQISRRRQARGEQVELVFAGKHDSLAWDASSGARKPTGSINQAERVLLERLVFDSVDEFILAQLRGASYYMVARNVQPDDAGDYYEGPLWNVVRVEDQEQSPQERASSKWRLYYINSKTGLIDKIVSEFQGERIEAILSDWREQAGEMFPATITWTSRGQTLITLNVTNAITAQ